ncbi:hypothetical protein ISN75_10810 [Dyella marensis]|uniref:hypothetical protein n=1 Tax=Dyella marensis TaxID=500610 RepID=UPI0031DC816B
MSLAPVVRQGRVIAQRLFDLAYAIDLSQARVLCADLPAAHTSSGPLTFGAPPLRVQLPPVALCVGDHTLIGEASVHVYDFGAITLAIAVPAEDLPWPVFAELARQVEEAVATGQSSAPWTSLLESVRSRIATALERPSHAVIQEDYLLMVVDTFVESPGEALCRVVDLVPLLAADARPLSADAREALLSHRFAYLADDCVVIARDRAFLYQPQGDAGVAAVLEVANAQLLELRYYASLLDAELPRMYDLVARTRSALPISAPGRLSRLARHLYTLVAEVTELTEKVDNALQVTGHPYLARIYTTTLELFGVPALGAAVDNKLAIIRDTYAALYDEASVSRAGLLELTIIALITVELVLALFRI